MTTETETDNQIKQKVVGKAVYIELERKLELKDKTYTTVRQILLFPEFVLGGVYHPIHKYERTLAINSKRPRWQDYGVHNITEAYTTTETGEHQITKLELDKASEFASKRMDMYLFSSLERYLDASYEFIKQPVVVEVSEFDAREVLAGRVPNEAIKRVYRARKAVGFPDLDRVSTVIEKPTL